MSITIQDQVYSLEKTLDDLKEGYEQRKGYLKEVILNNFLRRFERYYQIIKNYPKELNHPKFEELKEFIKTKDNYWKKIL
jgi:ERCC4-related helicase